MKVQFTPATGAFLQVQLKNGTVLDNDKVAAIVVTPFFSIAAGQGVALVGEVQSESRGPVGRFAVAASGRDGKLSCQALVDQSVTPLIDKPRTGAAPKPAAKPAAKEAQP